MMEFVWYIICPSTIITYTNMNNSQGRKHGIPLTDMSHENELERDRQTDNEKPQDNSVTDGGIGKKDINVDDGIGIELGSVRE